MLFLIFPGDEDPLTTHLPKITFDKTNLNYQTLFAFMSDDDQDTH